MAQAYSTTSCSWSNPYRTGEESPWVFNNGMGNNTPFLWKDSVCVTVSDASAGGGTDITPLVDILGTTALFFIWMTIAICTVKIFKIFT